MSLIRPWGESKAESQFDLSELKEFNPALVYGFNPEISQKYPDIFDYRHLLVNVEQYQDMLNAHLHAQNVILPEIKKTGIDKLTADQVLGWLHALHARIAKTLTFDMDEKHSEAGKFTHREIIRWHYGCQMQNELISFFANRSRMNPDILRRYAEENGIEYPRLMKFVGLLEKINADKSIPISANEKKFLAIGEGYFVGIPKLGYLYHNKKLSQEEQEIIKPFIKFGTSPKHIPKATLEFARKLLAKWKRCDPNNPDQIAELAHFAFYNLTEIHPFCNGNGRTATLLMNIILRSLGKPSILMRNPGEYADPDSSYSRAIKFIDSHPQLLRNHLKARIMERKPYENPFLQEQTLCRVKTAICMRTIERYFPEFNLDEFYRNTVTKQGEPAQLLCELLLNNGQEAHIRYQWQRLIVKGHLPESFQDVQIKEMQEKLRDHYATMLLATLEEQLKTLKTTRERTMPVSGSGRVLELFLHGFFAGELKTDGKACVSPEIQKQIASDLAAVHKKA